MRSASCARGDRAFDQREVVGPFDAPRASPRGNRRSRPRRRPRAVRPRSRAASAGSRRRRRISRRRASACAAAPPSSDLPQAKQRLEPGRSGRPARPCRRRPARTGSGRRGRWRISCCAPSTGRSRRPRTPASRKRSDGEAHHDLGPADQRDGVERVEDGARDQRRDHADIAAPVAVRRDRPSPRRRCRGGAASARVRGGTGCRPGCARRRAGRSGRSGRARRAGDRAPGAAARGRARRRPPPRRGPRPRRSASRAPNGPRTPTVSPAPSRVSAADTAPTARIVWTSRSGSAGSPLMQIGTSPTPKA